MLVGKVSSKLLKGRKVSSSELGDQGPLDFKDNTHEDVDVINLR